MWGRGRGLLSDKVGGLGGIRWSSASRRNLPTSMIALGSAGFSNRHGEGVSFVREMRDAQVTRHHNGLLHTIPGLGEAPAFCSKDAWRCICGFLLTRPGRSYRDLLYDVARDVLLVVITPTIGSDHQVAVGLECTCVVR